MPLCGNVDGPTRKCKCNRKRQPSPVTSRVSRAHNQEICCHNYKGPAVELKNDGMRGKSHPRASGMGSRLRIVLDTPVDPAGPVSVKPSGSRNFRGNSHVVHTILQPGALQNGGCRTPKLSTPVGAGFVADRRLWTTSYNYSHFLGMLTGLCQVQVVHRQAAPRSCRAAAAPRPAVAAQPKSRRCQRRSGRVCVCVCVCPSWEPRARFHLTIHTQTNPHLVTPPCHY